MFFTFTANLSGVSNEVLTDSVLSVASRVYTKRAAYGAARWLAKQTGRTFTIVPIVYTCAEGPNAQRDRLLAIAD